MRARRLGETAIEISDDLSNEIIYYGFPRMFKFGHFGMWFANLKIFIRYRLLWRLFK